MRRLLLLIPLCALLISPAADKEGEKTIAVDGKPFVDDGADLPNAAGMEKLARTDPVAFLENCLRRYCREVKGYTCTMQKQERIGDKLQPKEIIAVTQREKPFSVLLRWQEGKRLADSALYIEGENEEKDKAGNIKSMMLVHPSGVLGKLKPIASIDPGGTEAGQSGRYSLPEFGIGKGTQRTLVSWKTARANDQLTVEYLGEVKLPEAGDRACFKLRRPKYGKPEEDGVTDLTIYVDKENWLQVGSVLKNDKGEYVAQYFFRDIKLNPEFKPDPFTKEALTK